MSEEAKVIVEHDEIVELVEEYILKKYGIELNDIHFVFGEDVKDCLDRAEIKGRWI